MGFERCSGSGCSSSDCSSSSSSSSSSECCMVMAADRMVKVEMEAAEALAELGQLGVREGGGDGGEKWGTKGKRARKQVKSESPTGDSRLNTLELLPVKSDLAQDRVIVPQQQCEKLCGDVLNDQLNPDQDLINKLKVEKDTHLPSATAVCTASSSSLGCGRSRQNLTEAEKEARRIRRILANRESAQQTIRRRQALCEELTKKAADLTWENEKLKREKDKAVKEYESLELTNKLLKAQTARAIKNEAEEISGENTSSRVQPTPKPTNYPLFMYNHHPQFTHPYWPSTTQSPTPCQMQVVVLPSDPLISNGLPGSPREQDHISNINGHRPPFYVVPCSWFFPFYEHGNPPSSGPNITPEESSLSCQVSGSSTKSVSLENHPSSMKVRPEASGIMELRHQNKQLFRTAFSGDQNKEVRHVPTDLKSLTKTCDESCGLKEEVSGKKKVEVEAAAEARKRRKELTKLKNLHSRQCRMN